MTDLATLSIRVDASGAIRAVDQFGRTVQTASGQTQRLERQTGALGGAMGTLRTVVASVGLVKLGRDLLVTADQMRVLEGRLRLVTQSTAELAGLQRQLSASAQTTRTAYAEVVQLYARTAQATEALGLSQRDLLRFVELTNMAVATSGATSTEAAAALQQLSQGLAAGVLRGEEFNSVMEQTPGLARAIADGLGVSIGQLRTMAQEGQLTADAVVGAVLRMDASIRGDFATAPVTVAQAWQALKDAIGQTVGEADRATGVTAAIGRTILGLADATRDLVPTWRVTWLELRTIATDALLAIEERLARANLSIGAVIAQATGGAFGGGTMSDAAGRLTNAEAIRAANARELDAARRALNNRLGAPSPSGVSGGGTGTGDAAAAAVVALGAFDRKLKQLAETATLADPQLAKADRALKAFFGDLEANAVAVQEKLAQGLADAVKGGGGETGRVLTEQLQLALARFGSDFLATGTRSVEALFRTFAQLGRDAVGQVFARRVMDRLGDGLTKRLDGAIGALGGSGLGIVAGVAAAVGAVASFASRTSKWEEAAETFNKAARAQLAAAQGLAASYASNRERLTGDFLNYAGTETPAQREVRNLTATRNDLAQRAFALVEQAGASVSNQFLTAFRNQRFDELVGIARDNATGLNQTDLGRQALLDFADQLAQLQDAFRANTAAAEEAAETERRLVFERRAASLEQARDALALSGQSALAPTAQLAEARRQYDAILALAQGGDASALASLPDTARTLLDASRAVNASGIRYAEDYNRVRADLATLAGLQRTAAENAGSTPGTGTGTPGTIDLGTTGILTRRDPWAEELAKATAALALTGEKQLLSLDGVTAVLSRTGLFLEQDGALRRVEAEALLTRTGTGFTTLTGATEQGLGGLRSRTAAGFERLTGVTDVGLSGLLTRTGEGFTGLTGATEGGLDRLLGATTSGFDTLVGTTEQYLGRQDGATQEVNLLLTRTEQWVEAQQSSAKIAITVQQAGFQAVVAELATVREELATVRSVLRNGFTQVTEAVA